MSERRKTRRGDSTLIVPPGGGNDPRARISATQILKAADARGDRRAGESSVILREGGKIKRAGMGVAVKFAAAISAAIAGFMLLFGVVIYNHLKNALNEEIDSAGILVAQALATPSFGVWNVFHGAYDGTDFGGFEEEISRGERKIPEGSLTSMQIAFAEKRIKFNRMRLESLVSGETPLLDVLITSPDRTRIVRIASGQPQLNFASTGGIRREGVLIEHGTYTPTGGEPVPARSFVADILDEDGQVEGKATVVLSETSIQRKLAGLRTQVSVLALVFILCGIGVAFVMGRQITSPILELTRDVEVIARGRLDHRPKVRSKDEIGVLARTVDLMARSLEDAQKTEMEHQRQKHQLAVALEIQANLFPKELPQFQGFELAAHYQPGPEVGGDYYDVFHLPDGRPCLMVASASGTGIPAAMLTTMARSFTTAIAQSELTLAGIFKAVNRLLSPDLRRGMYVTALAVVLDPETGRIKIVNAGHNPLIKFDGKTRAVTPVHSDGIALGFDKGPVFERSLREMEITLERGDRIVLCTPGVFEIKNADDQELGEANFYKLVAREGAKNSTAFVNLVVHSLQKFTEGGLVESDITFLTLKRS